MKFLPLATLSLLCLLAACTPAPETDMTSTAAALAKTIATEQDHVSVPELSDWIIKDTGDYELVDIREPAEYAEGHIRNARNIPLAGLMAEGALGSLPPGRKVVVYSNGTAHAAQATLLLRLVGRDAYALLGGYNYWQAYMHDPEQAGVAEMDPVQRAQYQAVACFFKGDYVAAAGLPVAAAPAAAPAAEQATGAADPLGLGLGLGLGSPEVQEMGSGGPAEKAPADPLGLGLDLGLGGEEAESFRQAEPSKPAGTTRKLLIKAEC